MPVIRWPGYILYAILFGASFVQIPRSYDLNISPCSNIFDPTMGWSFLPTLGDPNQFPNPERDPVATSVVFNLAPLTCWYDCSPTCVPQYRNVFLRQWMRFLVLQRQQVLNLVSQRDFWIVLQRIHGRSSVFKTWWITQIPTFPIDQAIYKTDGVGRARRKMNRLFIDIELRWKRRVEGCNRMQRIDE